MLVAQRVVLTNNTVGRKQSPWTLCPLHETAFTSSGEWQAACSRGSSPPRLRSIFGGVGISCPWGTDKNTVNMSTFYMLWLPNMVLYLKEGTSEQWVFWRSAPDCDLLRWANGCVWKTLLIVQAAAARRTNGRGFLQLSSDFLVLHPKKWPRTPKSLCGLHLSTSTPKEMKLRKF